MTIDADVLVAGAGPAGSATALRLARQGHRVLLLDRATFPRDKPCSEYMSPETARHLAALGVLEAVDAAGGAALHGTRVLGPRGSALVGHFVRPGGTPYRSTGIGLSRRDLDAALVRAAQDAGASLMEETSVQQLHHDGNRHGVTVRDRSGSTRTLWARAVVGADGLGSVVARRAGLHTQGRLRRVAFVAHMAGVRDLSSTTELHVGPDGYVGINALGNGLANVALVLRAAAARDARGDATAFFLRQVRQVPALRDRLAHATIERAVMATGPFDAQARRSVADGVLLVGDAADFFDPFTGEGICTALHGAELAARVLHDALAQPGAITAAALAPYRTARRDAFLGKWMVERLIGYGMLAPALFDRAIGRLQRRGLADTLIGVTGHFVSPWRVLNPVYLAKMLV